MNAGVGKKFAVVVEKGMKYYTARVPSLPGCHTQAKTLPKLSEYLREAIKLHLMLKQRIEKSDFVGVQIIEA
ncbi:MAG: type II toxin-antitoxin system HicB family antitoxin [Candidatus Aenigmarchaeota archaeon]|nr:type II toxin-antitoxin system HicB family antitoxin [Candidatus Aenigmarchaeota archaeon]